MYIGERERESKRETEAPSLRASLSLSLFPFHSRSLPLSLSLSLSLFTLALSFCLALSLSLCLSLSLSLSLSLARALFITDPRNYNPGSTQSMPKQKARNRSRHMLDSLEFPTRVQSCRPTETPIAEMQASSEFFISPNQFYVSEPTTHGKTYTAPYLRADPSTDPLGQARTKTLITRAFGGHLKPYIYISHS